MSDTKKITVTFEVTEAQAIALEDFFATMNQLGNIGASRWCAFYADGDGNFHPNITIDGRKPQKTPLLKKEDCWKTENEYRIDFDWIAWKLHDLHPDGTPKPQEPKREQPADRDLSNQMGIESDNSNSGLGDLNCEKVCTVKHPHRSLSCNALCAGCVLEQCCSSVMKDLAKQRVSGVGKE